MILKVNQKKTIDIQAPGRICLFGDHQDYLGLPIIACAIDKYIYVSANPNEDAVLRIDMPDIGEQRVIDLNLPILPISNHDHFVSALKELELEGCIPNQGYDIEIKGTIPINAGLSSSSAIIVAWISFLLEAFGTTRKIKPEYIAKLAYRAEVLHYHAPGGMMDQYSISIGNLLFLNTVNGEHTIINNTVQSLIVGESGVPKETLDVLSNLKGYALEAIAIVQTKVQDFKIENATMEDYELYKSYVSDKLRPVFYGAIKNYEITKSAFNCLNQDAIDLNEVGRLMNAHHAVLKDILKITVPIIDKMIDGALTNGALGAKIVGSGGGGCIVALADETNEEKVIKGILDAGASAAYKVSVSHGVKVI
jgi:galactokinase